jgi:hypothetical protein
VTNPVIQAEVDIRVSVPGSDRFAEQTVHVCVEGDLHTAAVRAAHMAEAAVNRALEMRGER